MKIDAQQILSFWYGAWPYEHSESQKQSRKWYMASESLDAEIRERFGEQIEAGLNNSLNVDDSNTQEQLAYIILLDQFTRNVYRGSAKAFAGDALALESTLRLLKSKTHLTLPASVATFMCMPLQHSEDLNIQKTSVDVFNEIANIATSEEQAQADDSAKYAQIHFDIIAEFGRFPHRNDAMTRPSTPSELTYLNDGAHRFGQ